MIKKIQNILYKTGWLHSKFFWVDAFLIIVSIPFFLFPNRFVTITIMLLITWLLRLGFELINGPKPLKSPFTLIMLFFAAWLIIPILVTADPNVTLDKTLGLLLGLVIWRYIVIYFDTFASMQILLFMTLLLGCAFVAVGFLAVDWLEKVPAISAIIDLFPQQIISFSAIGSGEGVQPNQLAGLILWLFPLSTGTAFWLRQKNKQRLSTFVWAITIILVCILILSQSRGGWLGGLAAIGFGAWFATIGLPIGNPFRYGRWLLPIAVFVAVVLTVIFLGPAQLLSLWIDPPDETLVGNLSTLSFRQEVWRWAILAIQDFSFTGTGLGTFRHVVHRLYPIAIPVTYDIAHAHNVFLQVALDTGIPGLIIYFGWQIIFFIQGIQLLLRNSINRWLIVGLLASQAGFHFYGMVDTISLGAKPAMLFWLTLSLMHLILITDPTEV